MRSGTIIAPLCAVGFLSGAAALLFQTLWFRVAGLAFGNGLWASSLVLASFMAGLAAGNALSGTLAWRIARPIRFYAGLELAIGITGAALVWIVPFLTEILAELFSGLRDTPWLLHATRFPLAFVLMMVPATAMGATLPVLVKAAFEESHGFGRVLGLLYGWNTFGAVVGAMLGEAWLIAAIGVRGSAVAAAGLDALAGAGALLVAWKLEPVARRALRPALLPPLSLPAVRLLTASFLAGGIFLALEVVWFRFLSLLVVGTSLVFAILLSVVLAGIALGGLVASLWLRRGARAGPALPALALLAGSATLLCYLGFEPVARLVVSGELSGSVVFVPWQVLALSVPLMMPVALLSGVLFTALGDAAREGLVEAARTTGFVTLANTVGATLGSLLAGFVLLPWLGVEGSMLTLASTYLGVALLTWMPSLGIRGPRVWSTATTLGATFVLAVVLFPHGSLRSYLPDGTVPGETSRILAVREGRIQTLVYTQTERFGEPLSYRLFTDGFSMSGTRTGARRYMKAFVYLPAALHGDLRRALLISYGVGSTAKALTDTPSLESIDVVDISAEILEMSRIIFPDPTENPLRDPRVRTHVEDGRFFLQTTRERYDLITGEPPPPKYAGVVNLYTREYFALLRPRLAEGGMATYWLPVHTLGASDARAIIRAFCDVFPDCSLWNGSGMDWILLGTRDAAGPVSEGHFRRPWEDPAWLPELATLGFERPEQLAATFIAGPERLAELVGGVPPLVDDFPHRLSTEIVLPEQAIREPLFQALLHVGQARRDFARSEAVERLVPPAIREASASWFRWQAMVNRRLAGTRSQVTIADLHEVLTETALHTLPLWMLGSSVEEQRIVRSLPEPRRADPEVASILAAGALADRSYAEAARLYRAARNGQTLPRLTQLEIFALCMGGDIEQASQVARRLVRDVASEARNDAQWRWLESTFGLPDPRRS